MTPRQKEGRFGEPSIPRFSFLRVLRDLRGKKRTRDSEPLRARRPRRGKRSRVWANRAKRTQFGRGWRHRRDRTCKTNPIYTRGKGSVGQAPPYRRTPLRQTKPIRPGWASIGGERCKTNPTPGPRHRAERAKQSQFGGRRQQGAGTKPRTNRAKQTQFAGC